MKSSTKHPKEWILHIFGALNIWVTNADATIDSDFFLFSQDTLAMECTLFLALLFFWHVELKLFLGSVDVWDKKYLSSVLLAWSAVKRLSLLCNCKWIYHHQLLWSPFFDFDELVCCWFSTSLSTCLLGNFLCWSKMKI